MLQLMYNILAKLCRHLNESLICQRCRCQLVAEICARSALPYSQAEPFVTMPDNFDIYQIFVTLPDATTICITVPAFMSRYRFVFNNVVLQVDEKETVAQLISKISSTAGVYLAFGSRALDSNSNAADIPPFATLRLVPALVGGGWLFWSVSKSTKFLAALVFGLRFSMSRTSFRKS